MSGVASYNDILNRIGGNYHARNHIWGELQTANTALLNATYMKVARLGDVVALPSLPSGVTGYIPTSIGYNGSTAALPLLVAKVINLGSLDINTPTFTDGAAMPTQTVGNASLQLSSAVIAEVTTVISATPGSISITYKNQAGSGGQTSPSTALTAAATVGSCQYLPLAAADWGVMDITAATRTGGTTHTGVIKFWGLIPLGMINTGVNAGSGASFKNLLTHSFNFMNLGAADVIKCFRLNSATTAAGMGFIEYVGNS